MIASVAFRNFKALRSTSLKLVPFNLLIGPNGSGKTSLIEALLRLRTLAKLPLGDAESPQRSGGPEIAFHFSPPHDGIQVKLGCVSELVCDLLQVSPAHAPGWPALRTALAGIRSYLLNHEAMSAHSSLASGNELSPDGANLAAMLATLRTRDAVAFAALTEELIRILPEFVAIEFATPAEGLVSFALRLTDGGLVAAENLSQGTLYLLALLALAFEPAPPALLCIEEIDRGIHPRLLREVRDTLYRLSYPASAGSSARPTQIIATTHSPYLLDLFREHPEEIVLSHKLGAAARFERLADRPDIDELLREGSLGDMWFSGILGGVPEEK